MEKNTKIFALSATAILLILLLDIIFSLSGAISILYTFVILLSLSSNDEYVTVKTFVGSSIFIAIGLIVSGGIHISAIEGIIRLFSFVLMASVSYFALRHKEVERQLRDLNLDLELQVFARTYALDRQNKYLTEQIEILEGIQEHNIHKEFNTLNEVINNLKHLTSDDLDIDVEVDYD